MITRGEIFLSTGSALALASIAGRRRSIGLFALSNALVLYPALRRNCNWFGPVMTRFHTREAEVWLTIDDGPDRRDTPGILRALERFDARASFFMVGRKIERERGLVREVASAGHQVENHTYSHPKVTFWTWPEAAIRREIERTSHAIEVATGQRPRFFRSPVGMTNPFLHRVLASEGGMRSVGWSSCGFDGLRARGEVVVRRIIRTVRGGTIILLHEGGGDRRVETVQMLLHALRERGCRCVIPVPYSLA